MWMYIIQVPYESLNGAALSVCRMTFCIFSTCRTVLCCFKYLNSMIMIMIGIVDIENGNETSIYQTIYSALKNYQSNQGSLFVYSHSLFHTSALRLLALRGLQTLRVCRFTQWALADIRETIRRFLVLC